MLLRCMADVRAHCNYSAQPANTLVGCTMLSVAARGKWKTHLNSPSMMWLDWDISMLRLTHRDEGLSTY